MAWIWKRRWRVFWISIASMISLTVLWFVVTYYSDPYIHLSKETTVITEPLKPDGVPDYLAVINKLKKPKGITPETNSAVVFWKAIGHDFEGYHPTQKEKYLRELGMKELPAAGRYFIWLEQFVSRNPSVIEGWLQNNDEDDMWFYLNDELEKASTTPWKASQLPEIASWLKYNEKPIQLVVEASPLEHYYDPYLSCDVPGEINLFDDASIQSRDQRTFAMMLKPQVMLLIGEGKTEEAKECVYALHGLARNRLNEPMLTDRIIGLAIFANYFDAEIQLLLHADWTSQQLLDYRMTLEKRPDFVPMEQCIHVGERYRAIQSLIYLSKRYEYSQHVFGVPPFESIGEPDTLSFRLFANFMVDWNMVLKTVNAWFNRAVDIIELPRAKRSKESRQFEIDLKNACNSARKIDNLFLIGTRKRSEALGNLIAELSLQVLSTYLEANDSQKVRSNLIDLTTSLQAYWKDRGYYPSNLEELIPQYSDQIPPDLMSMKPLIYKTTGQSFLLYSVGRNKKGDGGKSYDDGADDIVVKSPGWQD